MDSLLAEPPDLVVRDAEARDAGFQDLGSMLDRAIRDHQAGRAGDAEAAYRRILDRHPEHPDALHLLGMLACDRGEIADALDLLDRAVAGGPSRAAFHNTRARALLAAGRPAEAERAYRRAADLRPGSAEIANNLACLLRDRGHVAEAVDEFRRARILAPDSADIACNLADALAAEGSHVASLMQFQRALWLRPESGDIFGKLGRLQVSLRWLDAAEDSFRASLRLRTDHAGTHNNLALVLQARGDDTGAREGFRAALECDPTLADAHYNLGCLALLDNDVDEARACHERALAASPLHGPALWARCMVELPILYDTADEIERQRARYAAQLERLVEQAAEPSVARALAGAVGSSQPFFLPYQGACDRAPMATYGALVARVLAGARPVLATAPRPGEKIRLGIVSGFFCEHTVWHLLLQGWLSQLDAGLFEVTAYHTGSIDDGRTATARALCPGLQGGPLASIDEIRAAIIAERPHVLLYPELGMDAGAARLAGERLAPLQCVAWGQPETSGLPTIDVFLSSALMEPEGADAQYTERLVPLPNLGVFYEPDEVAAAPVTRAELGLGEGPVFWCGQALYKYLPQHDDAVVRIAAELAGTGINAQFLFIGFARSRAVTARFRARLGRAFAARGLDAGRHCVFADSMPQDRFLGTVRVADVVLDSIGWSGGKSTLDMLAEAPAIVTLAGPLMRGRHTAAILTRIGVPDTIAATEDEYVATAVRLALDPAACATLRARVESGRVHAMRDVAPIRALEDFLMRETGALPRAA